MSAAATATGAKGPWKSKTVEALKRAEEAPTTREAVNIEWNAFRSAERGRNAMGRATAAAAAAAAGRYSRQSANIPIGQRISRAIREIDAIGRGRGDDLSLASLNLTDITDLPGVVTALARLRVLDCRFNTITDLPNLRVMAPRLEVLFCSSNQLTALPLLPDTLTDLYCDHNLLRALPRPLPPRLDRLLCSYNQFIYLPPLPPTLSYLACNNNQLRALPQLPGRLRELHFEANALTIIPRLPSSLMRLSLHDNPFHEPFTSYRERRYVDYTVISAVVALAKDYWDHQTVELLAEGMVDPRSPLSAGTLQPGRVGYGFPSGPNVDILKLLNIGTGLAEGFNETRARLRTTVKPHPFADINTNLFKGGSGHRRTKRSKKSRRHTRRK